MHLSKFFLRAYLTTMNMHLRLSEDETIGIKSTCFTQVVVSSTATEDITMHMTTEHLNVRLTSLIDPLQITHKIVWARGLSLATSNGCNLTTTKQRITYMTIVHIHMGVIYTTIIDISSTKHAATVIQIRVGNKVSLAVFPSIVSDVFFITLINGSGLIICSFCIIYITDITIIDGDVTCTIHSTTLATSVCIALNGRNTINEWSSVDLTDDYIGLTKNIIGIWILDARIHFFFLAVLGNYLSMQAHGTLVASTIDITASTAFYIHIGGSSEVCSTQLIFIIHRTSPTSTVDIFFHSTTQQLDVSGTSNGRFRTMSTTVSITTIAIIFISLGVSLHQSTLHNVDIGVIIFLTRADIGVGRNRRRKVDRMSCYCSNIVLCIGSSSTDVCACTSKETGIILDVLFSCRWIIWIILL